MSENSPDNGLYRTEFASQVSGLWVSEARHEGRPVVRSDLDQMAAFFSGISGGGPVLVKERAKGEAGQEIQTGWCKGGKPDDPSDVGHPGTPEAA